MDHPWAGASWEVVRHRAGCGPRPNGPDHTPLLVRVDMSELAGSGAGTRETPDADAPGDDHGRIVVAPDHVFAPR
jgi:hypothetical protein